jgi:hypothetical protein
LRTASLVLLIAAVIRDRKFASCRPKSTPFVRYQARTAERTSCIGRTASCSKPLEDKSYGGGRPRVGSIVCCNLSCKQSIVTGSFVGLAPPVLQKSLAYSIGGRPILLGEPGLLVDAIVCRRIDDVYQAHASMDTRADFVGCEDTGRTSYGRRL